MKNLIVEVTGTGSYVPLPTVPKDCLSISMQARTAVDFSVQYNGQSTSWTVKSGTVRTLIGSFDEDDVHINAAVAVIVEVEYSTIGYSL